MDYESSDILGNGNTLPVRTPVPAKWSGFSKTAFFLVLLLAAYVGAVRAWAALLKWREKSYRLFMRRQHGIPDNDHRPFNVAYAAVLRARREEEVANNRVHRVDVDELYAEADRRAAPVESDLRQRNPYRVSPPAWTNAPINGLPGRFNPLAPNNFMTPTTGLPPSSSHQTNFAERYNPNPAPAAPVVRFADEIEDASVPRRSNISNLNSSPRKHQKRALEEYDEVELDVPENPKKMTRVEGDELIDGDEDAEWVPRQRRGEKRGEKRVLREEDLGSEDETTGSPGRRVRGKRARKVSLENPDVLMTSDDGGEDMDVDEDERRESRASIVRGKKRDVGSTFDGEEGDEEAQKSKRKRRTSGKRKSDAAAQPSSSRGQKRDRDGDEEGSEGEGVVPGTPKNGARKTKKRGKKSKELREDDGEGSMDEGSVSKDKGKGRPIGDEWESNGVLYKIGPNGQRLRQALVKKAARRFTMPLDSQHPDKNANLEVCIETWLTEEEYKDFKSRHLLAWQDSPKGTQEPESMPTTPAVTEMPSTPTPNPVAKGKNLLWDSPASPFPVFAPSPAEKEQHRPQAHFRQSIASDVGMRVNPFDKALHVGADATKSGLRNGRRVGAVRETGPGLADSTNSISAQMPLVRRTFSKWEKQDLEAKAMMKMREANQTKQKEKELKEKLEREKKEREAAAAKAALAPIPTISNIPSSSAEPPKPPAITFTPSATPSAAPAASTSTKPPAFSLAPPTPAAAEPPKVSFAPAAPASTQPQAASNMFAPPSAPSGGAAAPSPFSNSFAKPPAPASAPAPTPAAAPSSNLFAPTPTPAANNTAAPSSTADKPSFSFTGGAAAAAPKPGFFAAPSAPAARAVAGRKPADSAPSGGAAAPANTGAPSFSFAPPPPQNAASSGGGGGSLLSRMGGAAPAPTSAPKPAEASAGPTFSFKPTGDQGKAPSPFGVPQQQQAKPAETTAPAAFSFKPAAQSNSPSAFAPQQQQQQTAPQQESTPSQLATPPPPKFNFAFAAKPAAAAATSTTSSSLTGALGSNADANKQQPAAFSFAAPKAAEKPATTGAPAFGFGAPTPAAAPAAGEGEKKSVFGFGNAGAPSAFGGAPSAAAPAAGEGEKKNLFGFGNAGAPSAFGGGAPSAFGGGSGAPSVFGGASGANSGTTTPTATPAFGGGGAFSGFGAKPAEEASKTTPAFGAGAPATNTAAPAPAPAFNFAFGGNNNASTTPAGTPSPTPFAAKPSAFGGPSVFGKPAEGTTSTTPVGSPFGFGSKPAETASGFGGAGTTPSIFGQAKPDGATTPSSSPFGAPATSSVFGGNAGPRATERDIAISSSPPRACGPPFLLSGMLSGERTVTPRPRPPAQNRRSSAGKALVQTSPPPPYASAIPSLPERERKPSYLGSPLPATLQSLRLNSELSSPRASADEENGDTTWLAEKSREELAELLLKADDLIKERETELGVTSAVCKSLYESNVTLKTKHDALVSRIPHTPCHSPPLSGDVPFPGGMHSQNSSFDGGNNTSSAFLYPTRPRRISVSPRDISLLADQNAELLQKLESLESEALTADRSGRRALKQLEREIQLLRDELERTQARSEELEKNAQVGTEKIVEEMWRKKKEREAKFRAMRNNTPGRNGGILDFAPPGPFTKASLSPNSADFPSSDDSYDSELSFEHPDEHSLVAQLLSKIQELEETNNRILQQQSDTADKLHAVQRETESISKVYEYFSAENGVEWEVVDEDGRKSPMEGTIRFKSFRKTLEAQDKPDDGFAGLLTLPRRPRKSVMNLFSAANEPGPSKLTFPSSDTLPSTSELSPLRYELSQSSTPYNMSPIPGGRPSLQSELGSDFGDDLFDPFVRSRHNSLYDISFSVSPSPTPNNLSLRSRVSDARTARDQSMSGSSTINALQLNVEPPSPFGNPSGTGTDTPETGSLREKSKDRYQRMSQTLLSRTSRWVDGRFSTKSSGSGIGAESTPRPSLPQRLSTALDLVMENFTGPATVRGGEDSAAASGAASPSVGSDEGEENTVVLSNNDQESGEAKKAMIVKFVLEVWLWLQFAIIIVVFLWAMAKRGPKSVLKEADRRAVVRRH
ncbi:hypothetical protein K438DRAFT_1956052 [Mycena galopus ATCC 62051]|nr:hypothetical protein K438DRAFT_1956052 [Mycena galopus ATCC 62051]